MKNLTKEEIAKSLECSMKTLERDFKQFNVVPVDFDGRTQLYAPADVERMKKDKLTARLARFANPVKIPTMNHLRTERARGAKKVGAR